MVAAQAKHTPTSQLMLAAFHLVLPILPLEKEHCEKCDLFTRVRTVQRGAILWPEDV
jgi:hypothetical protein